MNLLMTPNLRLVTHSLEKEAKYNPSAVIAWGLITKDNKDYCLNTLQPLVVEAKSVPMVKITVQTQIRTNSNEKLP